MSVPTAGTLPPSHGRDNQAMGTPSSPGSGPSEFAETATVQLEWRLSGLRQMYESSKGESKSKCVKSAVFGDADNLWEVLWYPNSGVQGGEFASLYLSCVPTTQEREQGIGGKWSRKGKWWFRFEVKVPEERKGQLLVLTSKDASDHMFAVKTANWGWQQFAKRDQLFLHPAVVQADAFVIVCTISAQPQLPAGYWLGLSLPPRTLTTGTTGSAINTSLGLGSWAGGDGANGGVAGGTMAAGGPKRVVPRDLVSAVGDMLDDPMYSDVEFVIPAPRIDSGGYDEPRPPPRRIYANKKLLNRCQYFDAMFHGGFGESEGALADLDQDPTLDLLSDSDEEDEAQELLEAPQYAGLVPRSRDQSTTTTRDTSPAQTRRLSSESVEQPTPRRGANADDDSEEDEDEGTDGTGTSDGSSEETNPADASAEGSVSESTATAAQDVSTATEPVKRESRTRTRSIGNAVLGPKKSRVVIRDAAWSTWWAVLYFLYTDIIYFAPLSSSFASSRHPRHSRSNSATSIPANEPRNRREWVAQWLAERGMSSGIVASDTVPGTATSASFNFTSTLNGFPASGEGVTTLAVGPRPVSAKSVYRLADKLGLPALKLRAYNHIIYWLKPDNIPAEVFSRFSCTFEDVRKVQVALFLKHWSDIKKSDTMQNIWKQIREGKHVGFEEVWPLIVSQLDFRPS